ncbi:pantoate--beta-alanine ligase [Chitinophaga agrisoli]|uniref:Pantothenate synthetase n=1 Tax=Chitinophaga agrisoli TaxID=2607653 RepID=A0A5B2VVW4_9BACT|nr:pantoate--beta-alanine ligase [Chitinophaga agrisoli]KAA2242502.1 pantoate--beta-alanine ligase [Chitinophaga agrisoli]
MDLFKLKDELRHYLNTAQQKGATVGFVPTMGALHQGHLSLIQQARQQCNIVVCSIFVNPTQFNDPADFEKYPVTIEKDITLLTAAHTDVLFLPAVAEMYPEGLSAPGPHYDFGALETVLEGEYRPGHFQGVGRVVHKLLDIVQPQQLFMGQKDLQQCLVVKRLLKLIESPAEMIICPTLRETDGLAMSSRNMRLSPAERQQAVAIYKTLSYIKDQLQQGAPLPDTVAAARLQLQSAKFEMDYLDVIAVGDDGAISFPQASPPAGQPLYAAVAARMEGSPVRLIDNLQVS